MTFGMYCIKDELSEYAAPVVVETEAQAKRYFRQMVETTKMMKDNPEDFSLWHVGIFESESGIIAGEKPKLIERAKGERKDD